VSAALVSMKRIPRLALVAALALCGCRSLPFPEPRLEGPYGKALDRWTRRTTLYVGLETRAIARIVYLSPEFVGAQAAQISNMRAELPDQAAHTLAKMREQARTPTFFAVLYTPDKTANDWNEPNSVWRLAVNVGLGQVGPDKVERMEKPFNAELRALYPYLDDYSQAYRLHFPDQPAPAGLKLQSGEVELIAAGAPGKLIFHWGPGGRNGVEAEPGAPNAPPEP
jgi:hypothetical protein